MEVDPAACHLLSDDQHNCNQVLQRNQYQHAFRTVRRLPAIAWQLFLFFAQRFSIRANVFSATVCGLVGGICSGLFSTGGPVIALYYLPASEKKENYLANIQFLFLLSNIMNLYTRCTNGLYTADLVPYTLIGFGGVLLGKQCGVHFVDSIDTSLMKKLVYSFIAISGLLLVLKRFL